MIRRRFSPPLLARVTACLALAFAARAGLCAENARTVERATRTAAQEHDQVAPPPPTASSGTSAATAESLAKKAREELHGLINLGVSLTDRGDFEAAEIAFRQVLNATNIDTLHPNE